MKCVHILSVCLILSAVLAATNAVLTCYVCDSSAACQDTFNVNASGIHTCQAQYSCFKMKAVSSALQKSTVQSVDRGCDYPGGGPTTCQSSSNNYIQTDSCICATDFCNAGSPFAPVIAVTVLASLLTLALLKVLHVVRM